MNKPISDLVTPLDEIIEAALLAAGEPLSKERLEALFDDHERPPRRELQAALVRLGERMEHGALELIETASGFQLRIRSRLSPWVSRLWEERPQRYSRALLETLALIAYRQPVTRGDIEEVRGVTVSGSIMRTLAERGWIRVVGQRDVPGRPSVYATTRQFLDDFGLKTLDALPPMHELKDFDELYATLEQAETAANNDGGERQDGRVERDDDAEQANASAEQGDDMQQAATGRVATDSHAGTASTRPGLSFADLEARLAERASVTVDDDGRGSVKPSTDEMSDDP